MSKYSQRFTLIYLSLIIVLAFLGTQNQGFYRQQWQLMQDKRELQNQLADLRSKAAEVSGAPAVRSWALDSGMVATPDGREALELAYLAPPEYAPWEERLEIRTIWR